MWSLLLQDGQTTTIYQRTTWITDYMCAMYNYHCMILPPNDITVGV